MRGEFLRCKQRRGFGDGSVAEVIAGAPGHAGLSAQHGQSLAQVTCEFLRFLVAIIQILGERLGDNEVQCLRQIGVKCFRCRRSEIHGLIHDAMNIVRHERRGPGQDFVENDTE